MNRIVDNYRARPFAEGQKPLLFDPGHRILFQSKIQRRRFGRRELAWSIHRARRIDRSIDRSVGDRGARARAPRRSFRFEFSSSSACFDSKIARDRVDASRVVAMDSRRPFARPCVESAASSDTQKRDEHRDTWSREKGRKEGKVRFDSIRLRCEPHVGAGSRNAAAGNWRRQVGR